MGILTIQDLNRNGMTSPDDLQLAGIIPTLADGVRASPGAPLRLHYRAQLVERNGIDLPSSRVGGGGSVGAAAPPPAVHTRQQVDWGGASVHPALQIASAPRVGIDGEGLFCLVAVELDTRGQQTLVWLVSNIPGETMGVGPV